MQSISTVTALSTITSTAECNELHCFAFNDLLYALRGSLFGQASVSWEGESFDL